jgi:hypothetical protein
VLAFLWIRKRISNRDAAKQTHSEHLEEADLEREGAKALVVRDLSRYARNFASDMRDESSTEDERGKYRERYEEAKSKAFVDVLSIKDDFYRGLAAHGLIDLLLAGDELERAKGLFATLDEGVQDSIVSTNPAEYARLTA